MNIIEVESSGSMQTAVSSALSVTVCGCGYVGMATALSLAHVGHRVTCIDIDQGRVSKLQAGILPFFEPNAQQMLSDLGGRISFADDYSSVQNAHAVIVAVGTPTFDDGQSDLSALWASVDAIRSNAGDRPLLLVNKSTVPVGTVDRIRQKLRTSPSVSIVSSPEFLRQGCALKDTLYPERLVIGGEDPNALAQARKLFGQILEQSFVGPDYLKRPEGYTGPVLLETDSVSAEITKYAANAFLAAKISFINEIAELCDCVGADVRAVAKGIGLDKRIGSDFLSAGVGWGGSCFPKDTLALARAGENMGVPMHAVNAAIQVNRRQRTRLVDKVASALGKLSDKRILILGMAFKPGTDDLRDAPSLDIARMLVDGGAEIVMHDPVVRPGDIESLSANADAIVLVTEWPEYSGVNWRRVATLMRGRDVFDGRNALDGAEIRAAGLTWHGMGAR